MEQVMELIAMILCLVGGGAFAGCMLIEGILAVLDRARAVLDRARAETDESRLGSAFRRPIADRLRTHLTRPVNPSAKRRTTIPSR
jgi:hypothetical protein